jgi:thiamine biosynthesis lipoprotein
MGMPVIIEIAEKESGKELFNEVFSYFTYVDEKFSTYKETSEISAINRGEVMEEDMSEDMKRIFLLSEDTKSLSGGYFDIINREGKYDPSGIVKGWAIHNGANILRDRGVKNFYVEIAGDIEVNGVNEDREPWKIGIQNPFKKEKEIIKVISLKDKGVATSGTSVRGQHIYNPKNKSEDLNEVVSLTVIGPNIYEADRFATAAFAMGKRGIEFIERLDGFEGYQVGSNGVATMTTEFNSYII